jgi:TPR repeat protein
MLVSGEEVPARPEAAVPWLNKALEAGRVDAAVQLALMYLEGKAVSQNVELAAEYCTRGAKANYPRAYLCLGYIYQMGLGKPKDPKMATEWYGKAARCGDVNSIYRMSQFYGNGEGLKRDRIRQYALLLIAGKSLPQAQEEAAKIKAQLNDSDLKKAMKESIKFQQTINRSCMIGFRR